MKTTTRTKALLAGAVLVAVPGVALAKDPVESQANKVAAEAKDLQQATNKLHSTLANQQDDAAVNSNGNAADNGYANGNDNDRDRRHDGDHDDDTGKWGLLGLLGLAGLLGLKRRDHDHTDRHLHVDRRDDVAGTRTGRGTGLGTDTTDTRL